MYIDHVRMAPDPGPKAEQVERDFFFSRVIEKNSESFDNLSREDELRAEVKELIEEKKQQIEQDLEEFGEPITTVTQNVLMSNRVRFARPSGDNIQSIKYNGDCTDSPVLLMVIRESSPAPSWAEASDGSDDLRITIITKSREDGESFLGWFLSEVDEIETFVGDYANVNDSQKGGEIVHRYFDRKVDENSNLTDWYLDDFANDFEKEVHEGIKQYTGVSISNVRIESDVGDNPDFDVVFLPFGGLGQGYAVEVKDYAQDSNAEVEEPPSVNKDSGELRSELVRKPKEFAEQADLKLISVVKGLSEEQYTNLDRLARSSNVYLLNEDNYLNKAEELIFEKSFSKAVEVDR